MRPQPLPVTVAAPNAVQPGGVTVRNLVPLFGWILMACFLAGVAAMTWMLHTEGTEPGYPPWVQTGALALFWAGGITAGGHLFRKPCTWLRVLPDGAVSLTRVWPLRWQRERAPREAIVEVVVEPGRDSEGDPYFRTVVALADGRRFLACEGHHAPALFAAAARLRAAIGQQVPGRPPDDAALDATRTES
ncbi:MAG: hypothetical protein K2X74_12090 [Acetobacteraceae bacterium]|nr:hypothetical protein [Acetobacteraceae bacterium]